MLLEYRKKYPNDLLTDYLTGRTVESGLRLVSLSERIRSGHISHFALRRKSPIEENVHVASFMKPYMEAPRTLVKIQPVLESDEHRENQFALKLLKSLGVVKQDWLMLSLNQMAGSVLNRYTKDYEKLHIWEVSRN
jgi:hypothetical protein